MKKLMKVTTIVMIVILICLSNTMVFASVDPSTFNGAGATVNKDKIDKFGQNMISIISTVGSIVSVIVLIVLGIKYMMGSAEEKAEYKKTLLPYIIGALLIFAASTIASIIYSVANGSWT